MTGHDIAALPAALQRLAVALEDVLTLIGLADKPATVAPPPPPDVAADSAIRATAPESTETARTGSAPESTCKRPPRAPAPMFVDTLARRCRWCHHPLSDAMRIDAEYCTVGCRKASWRARTGRS